MTFRLRTAQKPNTLELDPTIWILEDGQGGIAEVWPALGFNCYRWFATHEILYADTNFFQETRPTRNGIPVLFPFPNRIRDGRFTWDGKDYELPRNDPSGKNAIHGFACRHPWRVVGQGVDERSAWLTGEFHGGRDAPETLSLWPADYRIQITYRLRANSLRMEAKVDNPDRRALPFGLGYHPYFTLPFLGDATSTMTVPAPTYWELVENLPTGNILPVDPSRNLRGGPRIDSVTVDDILTDLDPAQTKDGLLLRGTLSAGNRSLRMFTSADFREMVVFTPPHGRAACLEPYTCPTDAINLRRHGLSTGWRVLQPGERWTGVVTLLL